MPELPIVVGEITGVGPSREELTVRTPIDDALLGLEIAELSTGILCAICFFAIVIWLLNGRHPADRSGVLMGYALRFICFTGLMGSGSRVVPSPETDDNLRYVLFGVQLIVVPYPGYWIRRFLRQTNPVGEFRRWLA